MPYPARPRSITPPPPPSSPHPVFAYYWLPATSHFALGHFPLSKITNNSSISTYENAPLRQGRTWHHRCTPDAAGQDLTPPPDIASGGYGRCPPRALVARDGRPLPASKVAARRGKSWGWSTSKVAARQGIAGVFHNLQIISRLREHTWSIFSTCNLIRN